MKKWSQRKSLVVGVAILFIGLIAVSCEVFDGDEGSVPTGPVSQAEDAANLSVGDPGDDTGVGFGVNGDQFCVNIPEDTEQFDEEFIYQVFYETDLGTFCVSAAGNGFSAMIGLQPGGEVSNVWIEQYAQSAANVQNATILYQPGEGTSGCFDPGSPALATWQLVEDGDPTTLVEDELDCTIPQPQTVDPCADYVAECSARLSSQQQPARLLLPVEGDPDVCCQCLCENGYSLGNVEEGYLPEYLAQCYDVCDAWMWD
ncbi:hypothetical protein GF339_05385 [candidate division KSB3 bacterium]|uniref:Uncharacterized protein n=1 Tax=candidate division KSB3 bacterium TaxID=2044937 RepID=A0A9D5JTV6_9BACT|nr:hypothetical protein [candidate division KSB3 bacterium]MBD3323995.1 hypothetical protein [candidate division KSB3 bacterium]